MAIQYIGGTMLWIETKEPEGRGCRGGKLLTTIKSRVVVEIMGPSAQSGKV
jgi:hypothetical protein